MCKKLLSILILLSFIVINSVKADNYYYYPININPSEIEEYQDKDYVIDSYNVDINVNENNTLDITETILAVFKVPKHGIIRNIPLTNTIIRTNGEETNNRTQISNVDVNDKYKGSKSFDEYKLQIGNKDEVLTGNKEYKIKYTYNLGADPLSDMDEFYFNIIGNSWDTAIGNVTFNITMPKDFDASKLGFSSGYYGSTNNGYVEYQVNNNTISGRYNSILKPNQALTIRLELPEGYFVNAHLNRNPLTFLMYLIPVICLVLVIFLWQKYGKDKKPVTTVEFYPPENLNSVEMAYIYKGSVNQDDAVSLLIYLAAKGYLKIEENIVDLEDEKIYLSDEKSNKAQNKIKELENAIALEEKANPNSPKLIILKNSLENYKNIDTPISYDLSLEEKAVLKKTKKNKEDITFTKLKDYDGKNRSEQIFFAGIFPNQCKKRKLKSLKNHFYRTINRILDLVKNTYKEKVFEKRNKLAMFLIILSLYLILLTALIIPLYDSGNCYIVIILIAFFTPFYSIVLIEDIPNSFKLLWVSLVILFNIVFFGAILSENGVFMDSVYKGGLIISLGVVGVIIICLLNMKRRTEYGTKMLGRIRGFKTFLETVEKNKLEKLVEENPTYFYDILPYTYVLGISDVWINKFADIALPEVDWLNTTSGIRGMDIFMSTTMNSISNKMSSAPSSSSGSSSGFSGGSSGGGSSGGGSGGGGGSSW